MKERASEALFLRWFYQHTEFGPAHGDVMDSMREQFKAETNMLLPKGYNFNSEGEESD